MPRYPEVDVAKVFTTAIDDAVRLKAVQGDVKTLIRTAQLGSAPQILSDRITGAGSVESADVIAGAEGTAATAVAALNSGENAFGVASEITVGGILSGIPQHVGELIHDFPQEIPTLASQAWVSLEHIGQQVREVGPQALLPYLALVASGVIGLDVYINFLDKIAAIRGAFVTDIVEHQAIHHVLLEDRQHRVEDVMTRVVDGASSIDPKYAAVRTYWNNDRVSQKDQAAFVAAREEELKRLREVDPSPTSEGPTLKHVIEGAKMIQPTLSDQVPDGALSDHERALLMQEASLVLAKGVKGRAQRIMYDALTNQVLLGMQQRAKHLETKAEQDAYIQQAQTLANRAIQLNVGRGRHTGVAHWQEIRDDVQLMKNIALYELPGFVPARQLARIFKFSEELLEADRKALPRDQQKLIKRRVGADLLQRYQGVLAHVEIHDADKPILEETTRLEDPLRKLANGLIVVGGREIDPPPLIPARRFRAALLLKGEMDRAVKAQRELAGENQQLETQEVGKRVIPVISGLGDKIGQGKRDAALIKLIIDESRTIEAPTEDRRIRKEAFLVLAGGAREAAGVIQGTVVGQERGFIRRAAKQLETVALNGVPFLRPLRNAQEHIDPVDYIPDQFIPVPFA